jgi:hypothetical protein
MPVDKNPFLVNTIDFQNSKVSIQSEQAKTAKGKSVLTVKSALLPPMIMSCQEKWW